MTTPDSVEELSPFVDDLDEARAATVDRVAGRHDAAPTRDDRAVRPVRLLDELGPRQCIVDVACEGRREGASRESGVRAQGPRLTGTDWIEVAGEIGRCIVV